MTEEQQLEEQLDRLRHRVRTSPKRSYTAMRAQQLIDNLTAPDCTFSTAAKLEAVKDTLRTFRDDLKYSDPTLHHPGDRAWNE